MKRKKFMRLLAVVMAASLAVTSQGIPVGLTTVEAAVSVTDASTSGLTKGHLYQEVHTADHTHQKDCYTESSAKQVQEGDNFFKSADSTAYSGAAGNKVQDGTDYYVAAAKDSWVVQQEDVKVNSALTENQYIYKDITENTQDYKVYTATNITMDATIHSIEEKRLQGTSSYKSIVWIAQGTNYADNSTYGDDAGTTAKEDETNLKQSGASAVTADGYYEITSWVKANSTDNSQADLPGAIKITDTSDESLKTLLKEESLTLNEVYVPLTIKSTTYDITATGHYATAGTDKVTIGDTTYYAVKEDESHKVTWATLQAASTAEYYTVKADGVYIQVVKDATLNTRVDHNTYSYTEVYLDGTSKATKTTNLTDEAIVKVTTSADEGDTTNYYIDVTDKFVTKIEAKNKNVQPVVKTTTQATALDDTVIVTLGAGAKTEEVAAASVTNDYDSGKDYTGVGEDNVNITKVEGSTAYLYAEYNTSSAGQVIKDTEVSEKVKLISSVSDLSTIANYVDVTGLSFKVKTVTPPDVKLDAATGKKLDDKISGADAFNATTSPVVVYAPEISGLDDAAKWTFKWKDVANGDTDNATYTVAGTGNAALTNYILTENDTLGKHEVSLVAYYNNAEVTEYDAVTFYVLKEVSVKAAVEYAALASDTESSRYVDISGLLTPYKDDSNFSDTDFSASPSGKITDSNVAKYTYSDNHVTYTLDTGAAEDNEITITGTLTNTKYIVKVEIPIKVKAKGTTISNPKLTAKTIYYKDNVDKAALLGEIIANYTGNESYYTVTFGDDKTRDVPTAVGNTIVYVSYENGSTIGSASTTLTVAKKPLTITAKPQTIKKGGNVSLDKAYYTIATTGEGGESVTTLPSGLTLTAKIFDKDSQDVTGTTLTVGGTYTYKYEVNGGDTVNYSFTSTAAALTVEAASGSTPASGTITDKDKDKDKDKTPSDSTATDTTTLTIQKNADGSKTVVDDKGNVVANQKVTVAGKSYITDKDGKVITSDKVTIDGKSYITDKNGVIETGKVTKTPSGNKVYVDKDGAIVKNKTVSYKGKKYYATKTGKIATSGFVKTARGNTVYATKSGVLKVNKAFKASNGKKYVADKNGKIVKGKKYTIGNKTYTTNKKGVIIKVTTKKK
jgi:hypothetical protein